MYMTLVNYYRTQLSDGLLLVLALAGLLAQLIDRALECLHVGDESAMLLEQSLGTEINRSIISLIILINYLSSSLP